ncbi:hypothetical protein [Fibrobacter sp.]|uniref:hypothetical protein n=1 Tax=Fibrobacter sp. TaxID=35828 RepID=UPI00388F98CE
MANWTENDEKTSNFKISVSPSKIVKDVFNALDVAFYISRTKKQYYDRVRPNYKEEPIMEYTFEKKRLFSEKKEFFCTFVRFLDYFMLFLV